MFNKIENGSVMNVQGLDCNIPPVGYVFDIRTKQLEYVGVYSRSENPSEQYWEIPKLPSWYKNVMLEWDNYDKHKKDDAPDFYDDRLEQFKEQEWNRRLNGFWFMNNGTPCFITGLYYLYLVWWKIDVGSPSFRIPDLEKFYFLDYCINDPLCMGAVEVTKRRFGKSFVAGLFIVEYVSRTKMAFGGIQSKTGKDAGKFFSKTVVNPFRRLPKFFRPEYDMYLGANPKSEIRFQKTNVRGKKAESQVDKSELGGGIDHQPSDKVAYDGQKIHRYVGDEAGKTVEVDVYERHEVVRYCLLDDGGNIIGKALYTTTVEKVESEKTGVQDAFKLLWEESDQDQRGENGMTRSGLYRFFMPAKRTRYFDKYGYPDEEKTLAAILADRRSVESNPRALNARIRKEPLTIEEAFLEDAEDCVFNMTNITNREAELREKPIYKRNVIFDIDPETQKVFWRDATKSELDFCWRFSPSAELNISDNNKFIIENGKQKPARTNKGAIAIDSYSNSQGGRKYGSKCSAWVGRRLDIDDPDNTGKPVGHLYGRPKEKDELHKQVMLCGIYFGYPIYYEHTADDYDGYFGDRGKRGYLGLYPMSLIDRTKKEKKELHRGTPITPFSITKQLDNGIAYFEKYTHKIDFEEVFPFAKKFRPDERTEYDMIVSLLILITVLFEPLRRHTSRTSPLIQTYT